MEGQGGTHCLTRPTLDIKHGPVAAEHSQVKVKRAFPQTSSTHCGNSWDLTKGCSSFSLFEVCFPHAIVHTMMLMGSTASTNSSYYRNQAKTSAWKKTFSELHTSHFPVSVRLPSLSSEAHISCRNANVAVTAEPPCVASWRWMELP